MNRYIRLGEKVEGYDIPVLNEREARGAAGILFALGAFSFFYAYFMHDFGFTKIFVTYFMIDFFIRVVLNPSLAPSMILARLFIKDQKPEYVGAPQKRWAWSIGLILAVTMFLIIVVFEWMTPIKIVICILCLILLFSEAAFGICIGCKLYHAFHQTTRYCPGDSCTLKKQDEIQKISPLQAIILALSIILITGITYRSLIPDTSFIPAIGKCSTGKCGTGKCGIGE